MYGNGLFSSSDRIFSMKERHIRIATALFICLIIDIVKPFGYTINVDFSFIATMCVCLIYPYFPSILWAVVFGYLRDCLSVNDAPVNMIEAIFMFMSIRYVFRQFPQKHARIGAPLALIVIHIWLNIRYTHAISVWFCIVVFLQAVLLYLALNYILRSWMKFQPAEYS